MGFAAKNGSNTGFVTAGYCGDISAQNKTVKLNGTTISKLSV